MHTLDDGNLAQFILTRNEAQLKLRAIRLHLAHAECWADSPQVVCGALLDLQCVAAHLIRDSLRAGDKWRSDPCVNTEQHIACCHCGK